MVVESDQLVIDVQGLSKSFDKIPAVVDVSLQVKKDEIFGFLGPNGSGKTTTIRMLCGLITPDTGQGTCLGYNILTQSSEIKRQVGYMPQKFGLYEDLSLFENLLFIAEIYGVEDANQRVEETLEALGLSERRDHLAGQLSGGWKQRLALACALLHHPKLLLLDEPTAGVDPKARRDFWDHIHHLSAKGITALVSTHYMDEAERCHRLAYIIKGHILVRGTADTIVSKSPLITWEVHGDDLSSLAAQLQNEPGVTQVISYGQALHVSGKHERALDEIAKKFKDHYTWKQVSTTLEDVFVSLVEEPIPQKEQTVESSAL